MQHQKGFSIAELSISILVISLIIAGIMAGAQLRNQALIKAVISEREQIMAAVDTFQAQYSYLPGDMPNASTYWPSCDATPSNCNGNNDGWFTVTGATLLKDERYRAWQQLTDSKIFPGSFSGTCTGAVGTANPGVNCPVSRYPGASHKFHYYGVFGIGNLIAFDAMTGPDSYTLDLKIDDGLARSGMVWSNGTCYSGNTYDLTKKTSICSFIFILPPRLN
jgi:type II secretory pathway pseudopilin PulG